MLPIYQLNRCNRPYSIRIPANNILYLYVKNPAGYPGYEDPDEDWVFTAELGDLKARLCNFQGFPDRVYCEILVPKEMFEIPHEFKLMANKCIPPIFINEKVTIFRKDPVPGEEPIPTKETGCTCTTSQRDCIAVGGTYDPAARCPCTCPRR